MTTETRIDSHRANAETAKEVVTAMAAGDLPRLLELWSPKLRVHTPQSVGPLVGGSAWPDSPDPVRELDEYIDAFKRGLDLIYAETEPPEFLQVAADGDLVIPLVIIRARLHNGTPYANLYCFPMRFEAGKVVEVWELLDTAYAYPLYREVLSGSAN
jgi:hypothetical protein